MTNKTLNTRLQLKYDLYSNWETNNPQLLKGEVAIAYVPTNSSLTTGNNTVAGTTPPNILMKVGDGTSKYNQLKFVSALAADVNEYAKQSKTDFEAAVKALASAQVSADIKSNADAIKALQDLVGSDTVNKQIVDYVTALKLAETYAAKEHTHTKSEITDFAHTHSMDDVTGLSDAITGAASSAAQKVQDDLNAYKETNNTAVSAAATAASNAQKAADDAQSTANGAQSAAEAAQGDVDALELLVGVLPEGTTATTVVGYVDAKTANIASDERVNGIDERLSVVEGDYLKEADKTELSNAIGTAKSEVIGASTDASSANTIYGAKKYAEEKVAELVNNSTEAIDSITELATAMEDNKDAIEALTEIAGSKATKEEFNPVKTKVDGIEAGAEVNIIETVKVNGVALTPDASRAVDVTVPTGALASKDKVAEADLETALATKINGKADTTTVNGIGTRVDNLEAIDAGTRLDALEKLEISVEGHKHVKADITDFAHTHTKSEITDFAHEHAIGEVTGLQTALDAKAAQTDLTAATDRVTALETRIGFAGDVLIFNCGNSKVGLDGEYTE